VPLLMKTLKTKIRAFLSIVVHINKIDESETNGDIDHVWMLRPLPQKAKTSTTLKWRFRCFFTVSQIIDTFKNRNFSDKIAVIQEMQF